MDDVQIRVWTKGVAMFSTQSVIDKITEAERLVTRITMRLGPEHEEAPAMVRWLIVADEATGLIKAAEEYLQQPQLLALRQTVNQIKPGTDLWAKYKDNPRRARAYFGKEIYEM